MASERVHAAGFHEDDALRSRFIRGLLSKDPPAASKVTPGSGSCPRVLMQFWDDGGSVPLDVQACLDSWRPLRDAGFEIVTYDDRSAASYITEKFSPTQREAFARCRHPAMKSDYFRLCYI